MNPFILAILVTPFVILIALFAVFSAPKPHGKAFRAGCLWPALVLGGGLFLGFFHPPHSGLEGLVHLFVFGFFGLPLMVLAGFAISLLMRVEASWKYSAALYVAVAVALLYQMIYPLGIYLVNHLP